MKYLITVLIVTFAFFFIKFMWNLFSLAKRVATALDTGDESGLTDEERKRIREIKEKLNNFL